MHKLFFKNKEPVLTRYTCNLFSKSQTLNIQKAKKLLGYSPKIKTMEGIRMFINDYHKNKFTFFNQLKNEYKKILMTQNPNHNRNFEAYFKDKVF